MLKIFRSLNQLDFSRLMAVYEEGNRENAQDLYHDYPLQQGILLVEQDFYHYLSQCFFTGNESFYAVWVENEEYVSALRMEPYQNGLLLEALETKVSQRRKGYAGALMREALRTLDKTAVYSHVNKKNRASLALHQSCGFRQIQDYGVYIDGSVQWDTVTLRYETSEIL